MGFFGAENTILILKIRLTPCMFTGLTVTVTVQWFLRLFFQNTVTVTQFQLYSDTRLFTVTKIYVRQWCTVILGQSQFLQKISWNSCFLPEDTHCMDGIDGVVGTLLPGLRWQLQNAKNTAKIRLPLRLPTAKFLTSSAMFFFATIFSWLHKFFS